MNFLKNIKCFLLDMDGTVFLENSLIGDMKKTLDLIRESGRKIVFLTNNSSKSEKAYIEKLKKLEIYSDSDIVFTSGKATIEYLKQNELQDDVYLVGTKDLQREFIDNKINLTNSAPKTCVLAYDKELTYEKLVNITKFITLGSNYIATHPDINCPAPIVYEPDVGSFIALIEKSTGKLPSVICGKPNKDMGRIIKNYLNLNENEIVMCGDRLMTDLKFAKNCNFNSILVLSGETTKESYLVNEEKADLVLESLNDVVSYI